MFIRALIFFFGLLMLSTGISVITHAGLGTGTISSVALVLSKALLLSMGFFVFLTNVFFFVLQTAVDPSRFLVKLVKQIPICFVFGLFFDAAYALTSFVAPAAYLEQLATVFIGTVFIGMGIAGMVFARLAILPPEGLVISIIRRWGGSFGNLRTGIDVFLVIAATSLSCLLLGSIEGVREGTLVAAVCGGQFAKVFLKVLGRLFPAHRPVD